MAFRADLHLTEETQTFEAVSVVRGVANAPSYVVRAVFAEEEQSISITAALLPPAEVIEPPEPPVVVPPVETPDVTDEPVFDSSLLERDPDPTGPDLFKFPRWFKRDGDNLPLLEALSAGLAMSNPSAALDMVYLRRAVGIWIDRHGQIYDTPRFANELDDDYRTRLIAEIINAKSTAAAIKRIIEQSQPGVIANVYVGTRRVYNAAPSRIDGSFTLDGSRSLGGGGPNTTLEVAPATFEVELLNNGAEPNAVRARAQIERIRAAGYIPITRPPAREVRAALPLGARAFLTRFRAIRLDGARSLDGTFILGSSQPSPEIEL